MSEPEEEIAASEEPTAPAWMATFGDLMSLLLCFFVLLMSFASMDVRRFAVVSGSMKDAFGVQTLHPGIVTAVSTSIVELSDTESTPLVRVIDMPNRNPSEAEQSLMARIEMSMREHDVDRLLQIESTPAGVVLRMPGRMLFAPGSAELVPEAVVYLHEVAALIEATPGDIAIEGHSDPSPLRGGSQRTNWHLSAERAVATLVHLVEVEGVDERRLRATGFGASRPLDGAEDDPAASRRVEFVFLREPFQKRLATDATGSEEAGSNDEQGERR
ncbi:MAG: OmpA family protein [Myxococcales bacterium]|nr:OmpA family protein [Myxococcales bacterium]